MCCIASVCYGSRPSLSPTSISSWSGRRNARTSFLPSWGGRRHERNDKHAVSQSGAVRAQAQRARPRRLDHFRRHRDEPGNNHGHHRRGLRQFPRHTLVLSSKLFRPMSDDINDRGLSRKHIMESIDKSLARIGTDYLDIYLCHRDDPETPVEETMRAMDDLVRAGKILYWGTSEWPLAKLDEARRIAGTTFNRPQVEQPQYNLLNRRIEEDLAAYVVEHGVGLTVYGPLASGLLTGKYDDGIPEGSRLARLAP